MKTSRAPTRNDGSEVVRDQKPAATTPSAKTTRAILLLGMHRSGTSAVARTLGMMGAYLGEPEDLLPAHAQDNPTGYWERVELNAAHDRFLQANGFSWDRIATYDSRVFADESGDALSAQLHTVIGRLDASGRPWLVKDPRLCLLLPHWQAQLETSACIVVVRDPREIAASMHTGPRGAFTSPYVIALWEKYLRTLLADLAGSRVLFVSYADLLDAPRQQCRRLLNGLQELDVHGLHVPADEQLEQFLDTNLRRSVAKPHMQLSSTQQALFDWLQQRCHASGTETVAGYPQADGVDDLLAEFEHTFDARNELGRQRGIHETAARLDRIQSVLNEQAGERTRWLAELAEQRQLAESVRAALAEQSRQNEQAQRKLAAQREHAQLLQRELDARDKQVRQIRTEADAIGSRLASITHEHELTQTHVRNLDAERESLSRQLTQLGRHATAMQKGLSALHASWSWKITAPLRAIANLVRPRTSYGTEQRLYRWYYALPGINASRKRAFIVWLHKHATWLTRNTLSYQILERSQASATAPIALSIHSAGARRMDAQRADGLIAAMRNPPLISIVMPVYNVESRWLMAAVESVRRQYYPHWELCIVDDASTNSETRETLDELERSGDRRVKIRRLRRNSGIALASNAALKLATGDYVGLLDNDDELTRDALLEVARTILDQQPDIVYSDEDKLDVDGNHVEAHFKPDFNPDYFLSINYLCHFTVLRRDLLKRLGGFRAGYDGAQDFDLFLRASEHGERIAHIPKILYHWRKTDTSTATASATKPKSWDAGRRALAESLLRRTIDAVAETGPYPNTYRVRRTIAGQPLVSILIPFRDQPRLLSNCIDSILGKTDYPNFEIVGIDNGSVDSDTHKLMRKLAERDERVRFISHDVPFNYSEINNFAATQARGEHLLLLNNDTEVISAQWLRAMLEHSQRPEVGVVGAQLLYPDKHIQHAGVIIGIGGVAGHAHLHQPSDRPGYFARAQLPQNMSAVTFACAMTRRDVFEQLDGLNATDLSIAFNDIDYCLRAREAGYLIVYTPYAQLYHHESRTRGYEDNPEKQARFSREIAYMRRRHCEILQRGDPYYNPNLRLDIHDFSERPGYVDALPI
ncbi:MAG: glycosyltransferase [Rudaea sp.]